MNNHLIVRHNSTMGGFTLIELMITVAIIGILAAIAYPSYTAYVQRAKRANGQADLLLLANAMERYYTARGTYVGADVEGGAGTVVFANHSPSDADRANRYYNLSIVNAAANSYLLQATATGSMASDAKCENFTLDGTGAKTISGSGSIAYCWKQ